MVHAAEGMAPGYTLLAPLNSGTTFLLDAEGRAVHTWERDVPPGNSVYLLEGGTLLRAERVDGDSPMNGGGAGGRIVELDWNGDVVWSYELNDASMRLHHDIEPLPNGNVLVIVWEQKTRDEAAMRGRDPHAVSEEQGLWPDAVLELRPVRPSGAEVVWEWHAFDHLVQDFNEELEGHGVVAQNPRRINVNIGTAAARAPETEEEAAAREERDARLRGLGYLGGGSPNGRDGGGRGRDRADWMHTNSIDYDAELDLIALSLRNFSEVWVIDHSTTTEEARGSSGGRQGVGGDIVWRYGNPVNHHAGDEGARVAFGQHDARWTRYKGNPALTIFNNGEGRFGEVSFSSVDLIALPVDGDGKFAAPQGGAFTPRVPTSTWTDEDPGSVYSSHISGAERLPHGGYLVCDGEAGRLLEVSATGEILWDFVSPIAGKLGGRGRGRGPRGGPPRGGPPENGRGGPPRGRGAGPRGPFAIFRASRIAPDHPALEGKTLEPRPLPSPAGAQPGPASGDRPGAGQGEGPGEPRRGR